MDDVVEGMCKPHDIESTIEYSVYMNCEKEE